MNAEGLHMAELALADITSAEILLNAGQLRPGCFHIQQGIEKTMKLVLLSHGVDSREHNIVTLERQLKKYGLEVPKEISMISVAVTRWEASSRYDDTFTVSYEKAYRYLEIAKRYFSCVAG